MLATRIGLLLAWFALHALAGCGGSGTTASAPAPAPAPAPEGTASSPAPAAAKSSVPLQVARPEDVSKEMTEE